MSLDAIKALLLNKIGLDTVTIGESSLQHALDKRVAATQCDGLDAYFNLVSVDRSELEAFIEEIVVPETWFFRNSVPFSACVERVEAVLKQRMGYNDPIRILSVPCSTGEEPYSIAIAIAESRVNLNLVTINAIDISRTAIDAAQRADYHRNAFREMPDAIREKYFSEKNGRFRLSDDIRAMVKFEQANVILSSLSPMPAYYDIIFCRNLLIYFNDQLRRQIYEKLYRALSKGGCLFVGHVETTQVDKSRFQPLADQRSYGFIKTGASNPVLRHIPKQQTAARALTSHTLENTTPMASGQSVISLNFVDQLIDKGDDARAAHLLQQYLSLQPQSVEARFLEGKRLYCSAQVKEAESWLKKLLYLHPNHQDSLQLLLQMAEKRFDLEAVRNYRNKLQRIRKP